MKKNPTAKTSLTRAATSAWSAWGIVALLTAGVAACSSTSPSSDGTPQQMHATVNGEPWASGAFWSWRLVSGDTTILQGLGHPDSLNVGLKMHIINFHGTGTYSLGAPGHGSYAEVWYVHDTGGPIAFYSTNDSVGGTLNTAWGETSGTFSFAATPSSPLVPGLPDRVQVTLGNFYLRINPTQ